MVKWYLSNAAQLLERLRGILGGSERPDQLYWYSGVMPVIDVNVVNPGVVKTVLLGSVTSSAVGVVTANMTLPPTGKRWRVIGLSGQSTATTNISTLAGLGISGPFAAINFWFAGGLSLVQGGGSTLSVPSAVMSQPFYIYDTDPVGVAGWQVIASFSAFTSAVQWNVLALVIEENSVNA